MPKYNHVYEIAFSVTSETKDGGDVTADMLWLAIRARFAGMGQEEIVEAAWICSGETVEE